MRPQPHTESLFPSAPRNFGLILPRDHLAQRVAQTRRCMRATLFNRSRGVALAAAIAQPDVWSGLDAQQAQRCVVIVTDGIQHLSEIKPYRV